MAIDRDAGINYAKTYWNRVCDDDVVGTHDANVSLTGKRKTMNAPADQGWELYFIWDGGRGENAVFGRVVNGQLVEKKPDPVLTDVKDRINDCTHYVSRCVIKEGINIQQTSRADEFIRRLIQSPVTKVLALQTVKDEGQKIIDSGVFKKGDVIGYCLPNGNYHHSAMFTGKENSAGDDQGGIACHSVCRYGGLSKTWNQPHSFTDDGWFINSDSGTYTLIHFSEDDPALDISSLLGWWNIEKTYYFVALNGTAQSTPVAPLKEGDRPHRGSPSARLIQGGQGVVFIWHEAHGGIEVETWKATMQSRQTATVITATGTATATRVFSAEQK